MYSDFIALILTILCCRQRLFKVKAELELFLEQDKLKGYDRVPLANDYKVKTILDREEAREKIAQYHPARQHVHVSGQKMYEKVRYF